MKLLSTLSIAAFLANASLLPGQTYDQQKVQLQFLNHYGKVYQRGSIAPSIVGSEYFNDNWQPMDIKFKDTILGFDQVKLNLFNSNIEVSYQGEEKVIAGYFFEYVLAPIEGEKRVFIQANLFKYDDKQLSGFMEVWGSGKEKVMVHHYVFVKEPHAQAHITGGYTMNRLMKASDIYIYNGEALFLIKRKKDLEDYYKRRSSSLDRFLKSDEPDLKNPKDLLKLVEALAPKENS
jgi:hypothetical protein